jgi:hypothetical protein
MEIAVYLVVKCHPESPEEEAALALIKPDFQHQWWVEDVSGDGVELGRSYDIEGRSDERDAVVDSLHTAMREVARLGSDVIHAELRVFGPSDATPSAMAVL